jgi:hypothetical protein
VEEKVEDTKGVIRSQTPQIKQWPKEKGKKGQTITITDYTNQVPSNGM